VDVAAPAPGIGTQANPYHSIQYAIAQPTTVGGDTLEVAPGTYMENVDYLGKAITVHGTAGAASTTIDANYSGNVVSFINGEGPASVLDGLTVMHGGNPAGTNGGIGVNCPGCSPTIRNCTITQNGWPNGTCAFYPSTWGGGKGILGDAFVTDCTISNNAGGGASGNVTAFGCLVTGNRSIAGPAAGVVGGSWTDCTISGNSTYVYCCTGDYWIVGTGGASNATLVDCAISGNTGEWCGGAAGGTLLNCTVSGNTAKYHGNGAGASGAQLNGCVVSNNLVGLHNMQGLGGGAGGGLGACTATDCLVSGNTADSGGGVAGGTYTRCILYDNHARLSAQPGANVGGGARGGTFIDCVISGNHTDPGGRGGGLVGPATATNCTIYGNTAGTGAGSYSAQLTNCILWANAPDQVDGGGVTYSDVQGGAAGNGNILLDPLLLDPAHQVFALRPGSPCINAGDPSSPLDPDGSQADMGAYPYDPLPIPYCAAKRNSLGCLPAIGSTGMASLSGSDNFHVVASDVLNEQPGLLIWSGTPGNTPWFGGTLCISPPILRTPVQSSGGSAPPANDCSGTYSFFFSHALMSQASLLPGSEVCAQYWSRDLGFAPPDSVGLTNALHFVILP
jgi:hypothetical protein